MTKLGLYSIEVAFKGVYANFVNRQMHYEVFSLSQLSWLCQELYD